MFALSACDEVERNAFGGLVGTVGYPPIANCDVEIYDAVVFKDLDSPDGLITKTRTGAAGKFAVEFAEFWLGHPLVVVARPGPTAQYRDFGAPGSPDVSFDAPRQPWVAVLGEWVGGEDTVTINPITTMAFHALMRLPAAEVGGGALRFDREVTATLHAAIAANFGFKSDPGAELPAPPGGPEFVASGANFLEDNERSTAYTYACLQLAKAANQFCNTSPGADDALDFFEALARDAQDASLDGMYFGQPEPFLNQVPIVVGREIAGASKLFTFIATHALTPTEQSWAGVVRGGNFDPAPAFILGLQQVATGACRATRVDSIDVWSFPYSGNVELTIRGAGMRASDWFVIRSTEGEDQVFIVDRTSVGVDGTFNFHSDAEWRIRLPDLGLTTKTVGSQLRVATGVNFRRVRFELINKPEMEIILRQVVYILNSDARITGRTEPLLVHAAVGRVDLAGFTPASSADCDYGPAVDPATLVPGTDRVYELRARVCNPAPDAVNNFTLDLVATTFTQSGNPVIADLFGGAAAGRAVILPGTLPVATLNPGDVATLGFRFIWLDTAPAIDLAYGPPVFVRPVLSGVSAGAGNPTVGTNDIIDFTRTVSVAPVRSSQTALLGTLALSAPAGVTEGGAFDMGLALTAIPAGAGPARDLVVDAIDLTVTFGGASRTVRLGDSFFSTRVLPGVRLTAFADGLTGGRALPLTLPGIAPTRTLRVRVELEPGVTGTLQLDAVGLAHDAATGTPNSAAGNAAVNVTP